MSSAERKATYADRYETQAQFAPPAYASVDTAFLIVDVHLFCQLVDLKDRHPDSIPHSYETIYQHVRRAVDLCHCDGEIKDPVAADPSLYIRESPTLADMLTNLRLGGKQVFLLTNSLYDYTEVVCNFLLGESWRDYFDLIICGARKPGFLLDPYLPLFQVNTEDASLVNVEISGDDRAKATLARGKVFQGGNWNHLHRLLGLTTGARLMYVGDHMYSDILRSKRTLGWRTVLIVPELYEECEQAQQMDELRAALQQLRAKRAHVDANLRQLAVQRLDCGREGAPTSDELDEEIVQLQAEQAALSEELSAALGESHESYHPLWGELFKAGHQNSRWAQQVQDYACLYTSHASNLLTVAPDTSFRALSDLMPHDRAVAADLTDPDQAASLL